MILTILACAFQACAADPTVAAVTDKMRPVALPDVKVAGFVGAVQDRFLGHRVFSDFARNEIWKEAHEAFAHPDDDVFQAPIGMWKGEYWGKLMISACRAAAYAHDERLKHFLHEEALRLIRYQHPDGYLGTYVNPAFVVPTGEKPVKGGCAVWNWNLWCRKYTLWGLLACYRLTGDTALLTAADRAMTQQIDMLERLGLKLANTGTTVMRGLPPCSILKPLVWLYQETGKRRYLDYAREIYGSWSDPTCRAPQFAAKLASGLPIQDWYPEENGQWGKAYEMMSCLQGILELYRVTGDASMLKLVRDLHARIRADELNLCLSVGYNDQFWGARRHLNGVSEPCDAIHWMRLNQELWRLTGDVGYVDAIEETFYNAFLAGIRPDGAWGARCVRSHGRHLPAPPQSGMKLQHCCVNNMPRGFLDAAETIAARDETGALALALYHDAAVRVDGTTLALSGNYPVSDRVHLAVTNAVERRLRLRVPAWCARMTVRGRGGETCAPAGSRWVDVTLPRGASAWDVALDMNPRLVDSDRAPVEAYGARPADPRVTRWADDRDLKPLLRKTPAAQLMWGPLLLAKSIRVGDAEADILDPASLNGAPWKVRLQRRADCPGVWGAWTAVFEKEGARKAVGVCDYASSAVWSRDKIEFSIFF